MRNPYSKIKLLERKDMPEDIYFFLCDLHEWLEQRSDADYQGEETGYVANDEMKILTELDNLIDLKEDGNA